MQIDVKVGELNLIKSGSIVFNQTNNVVFKVVDIEIELVFIQDANIERDVKAQAIGNKKIQLQITNFDNVLGTAQNNPLNIASLSTGENLYLQYAVYAINSVKILHYSWYSRPGAVKENAQANTDAKKVE